MSSPPVFSAVRVTRSLVLYVYFVDRCLSFCTFSFGHFVVCPYSIYGFWLPLWYLQNLLNIRLVWYYDIFRFEICSLCRLMTSLCTFLINVKALSRHWCIFLDIKLSYYLVIWWRSFLYDNLLNTMFYC